MSKFSLFIILLLSINALSGVNQSAGNEQGNPFVDDFGMTKKNTREVSWPVSLESLMLALIDLSTKNEGVKYVGNNLFRMAVWKSGEATIPQEKVAYLKELLFKQNKTEVEKRHYRELESCSKKIKTSIDFMLIDLLKNHFYECDDKTALQKCYTDLYQEVFDRKPCSMEQERSGDTSRFIAVSAGTRRCSLYLSGINKDDSPFIFSPGLTICTVDDLEGKAKAFKNIREITKPLLENYNSDDATEKNDLACKSCCQCGHFLKRLKPRGRIYNRKKHPYSSK